MGWFLKWALLGLILKDALQWRRTRLRSSVTSHAGTTSLCARTAWARTHICVGLRRPGSDVVPQLNVYSAAPHQNHTPPPRPVPDLCSRRELRAILQKAALGDASL